MRATRALAKILMAVDRVLKFEVYHIFVSNDQYFCNLSSGSVSSVPKISQINLQIIAVSLRANGARAKILVAVDCVLKFAHNSVATKKFAYEIYPKK
jgi:hypothetical protein